MDDDMKRERRQKKQKGQCSAKHRHAEAQNSSLLWRSDGNKLGKDRKRKSGTSYTPQDLIRLWKPEALVAVFTRFLQDVHRFYFSVDGQICMSSFHKKIIIEVLFNQVTRGESSTSGRNMKKELNKTK